MSGGKRKLKIAKSKTSRLLNSQHKEKYPNMNQICQILWCPLFPVRLNMSRGHIIKIMTADLLNSFDLSVCVIEVYGILAMSNVYQNSKDL
jgi:hypothetical protein